MSRWNWWFMGVCVGLSKGLLTPGFPPLMRPIPHLSCLVTMPQETRDYVRALLHGRTRVHAADHSFLGPHQV